MTDIRHEYAGKFSKKPKYIRISIDSLSESDLKER